MTKIVHEFCGICIQRRDIAGCFSGVWGGIACSWWGRVADSNHSPPVRRREDRGTASLGAPAVFCIALCAIARHSLLVVGQGCGLQPFAACSAAGGQRNSLAQRSGCFCIALCAIARHSLLVVGQGCGLQTIRRLFGGGRAEEQPRPALRLFFASRFARLRGIAAQAKKNGSRQGQRLPGAMLPFRFLTP